jgi:D-methionine transport system substrate-binding protein
VLSLTACSGAKNENKIVVGASPAPHAEILEFVKPMLAEQGIELVIEEFTDYVLPNQALDAGDLDANYFQHLPYLLNFKKERLTSFLLTTEVGIDSIGANKKKFLTGQKFLLKIILPMLQNIQIEKLLFSLTLYKVNILTML